MQARAGVCLCACVRVCVRVCLSMRESALKERNRKRKRKEGRLTKVCGVGGLRFDESGGLPRVVRQLLGHLRGQLLRQLGKATQEQTEIKE